MRERRRDKKNEQVKIELRIAFPSPFLKDESERKVEGKKNEINPKIKQKIGKEIVDKIQNLGLLYDKFVPLIKKGNSWEPLTTEKELFLSAITEGWKCGEKHLPDLQARLDAQKKDLEELGYICFVDKFFTTDSRLVIGLGSESVLETSLTFHKVWGVPYIPSTALKGVTRMVAFWEMAKGDKMDEELLNAPLEKLIKEKCSDEKLWKFKYIFGAPDFKGLVLFLDAYPRKFELEVDIINVHYPEYYSGRREKAEDYENPNPIFFLTCARGSTFRIVVLLDEQRYEEAKGGLPKEALPLPTEEEIKNRIEEWVKTALEEFGVGAKTRLGYGIGKLL